MSKPAWIALSLLLCLVSAALADTSFDHRTKNDPFPVATEEDVQVRGYKPGSHPGLPWTSEPERTFKLYEVDRFLREQVQPELEAGQASIDSKGMGVDYLELTRQDAIAHYLKALVLIEQERLRREAR